MRAFAIRAHRRRFIGLTRHPVEGAAVAAHHGWRPFRFVEDPADAEKFGSRPAAELFMRGLARIAGAFEVVEIGGSGGGRAVA